VHASVGAEWDTRDERDRAFESRDDGVVVRVVVGARDRRLSRDVGHGGQVVRLVLGVFDVRGARGLVVRLEVSMNRRWPIVHIVGTQMHVLGRQERQAQDAHHTQKGRRTT
jgi:hypothetical protein